LKAAKSRQETYANKRRRPLEFEDGNHVYLRVSPMKGVKRFGVKGKLAPHKTSRELALRVPFVMDIIILIFWSI
jgi:hypothetical protein